MNPVELEKVVAHGESDSIEFKKSTAQLQRAGETLCGFLNAKGGKVFIGITPDGKIRGQEVTDKTLLDISGMLSKLEPSAQIAIHQLKITEKDKVIVLAAHPEKTFRPYTFNGRAYQRVGTATCAMPRSAYQRLLFENNHGNSRWEKEIAVGYSISDLDEQEILKSYRLGVNAGRLPEGAPDGIESILNRFSLLEEGRPLKAALVLFGKTFLPDYPQCQLRLARFKGIDKTSFLDEKQLHGNAFTLLDEAMLFLNRHLPVSGKILPNVLERKDEPLFPTEALREALVNAFCHRSYEQPGGAISVAIFDDRLEIWSDGVLPFGLKPEDLRRDHSSKPRNPLITNVFYRRGLIEQWGRGTQKIIELCTQIGHPEPELLEQAGSFVVRFIPAGYVAPLRVNHDLTERQREILHSLAHSSGISFEEIKKDIDSPPKDRTLRDDLNHLKKLGLIRLEGRAALARWHLETNKN